MSSKLDAQGRAYATGKRKNAVARVWIKPGKGKITINGRDQEVYFARPVLRMMLAQPLRRRRPPRPVRRGRHGGRLGPLRPGRRGAPWPVQGADLLRARPAHGSETGRLPDPRQPRGRAQEVRQAPRLAAASSSRSADLSASGEFGGGPSGPPFSLGQIFVSRFFGAKRNTRGRPAMAPPSASVIFAGRQRSTASARLSRRARFLPSSAGNFE